MEKIRTYNIADISRAGRMLHDREVRVKSMDFEWNRIDTLEMLDNHNKPFTAQQQYAHGVAEKMYQTHKEWTDKKFSSLVSYVQADSTEGAEGATQRMLTHYKNGLATAVTLASDMHSEKKLDHQDTVVSYTTGFVNMLRTCKRLNIDPDSGLKLAQQSYNISGGELAQHFKEYPALGEHVINRAADSTNPQRVLGKYLWLAKRRSAYEKRIKERELLIKEPSSFAHSMHIWTPQEGRRYKMEEGKGFKIEGVPLLEQKHGNWCGYASLSMVLQYWGYSELIPEKLYEHIMKQPYDELLEWSDRSRGPSIDTLALAAKELTPLKVDLITMRQHEKLKEKGLAPEDVLDAYITKKKVPSIVRVPGHFMVATGLDKESDSYIFNDPLSGAREVLADKQSFCNSWQRQDKNYKDIRDSRNMILAIYPPKEK